MKEYNAKCIIPHYMYIYVTKNIHHCRPNMYLEVKERPPSTGDVQASYNQVLDPYFLNLQKDKTDFPRTIMYMPLKWCGYAHQRYLTKFEDLHINQSQEYTGSFSSILAQFHAPQTSEVSTY